jgi:hypothetical protein
MRKERAAICFQCGGPADLSERLNRLPGGDPCPVCSDRLLSALPPLLPGFRHAAPEHGDLAPMADGEVDEPA